MARDRGSSPLSSNLYIEVEVRDVNDNAPTIHNITSGVTTTTVPEVWVYVSYDIIMTLYVITHAINNNVGQLVSKFADFLVHLITLIWAYQVIGLV